ncbi:MAG: hypothetical protein HC794_06860 [Nitrospiraceae bacterium]|nr:hypothetical protein [Nitrospiraceae bacterium]
MLPDKSDIFVSHADWSNYRTMLKVIKRYIMPLKRLNVASSKAVPIECTLTNKNRCSHRFVDTWRRNGLLVVSGHPAFRW